jgi:uncharacterized membrane protein YjjB (DUF3815 family)
MQTDLVKYSVIAAMAAAALGVIFNVQANELLNAAIALAYGLAVYFTVYAKLTTDAGSAAAGAIVLAAIAVALLLYSLMTNSSLFVIINLVAAVALGYAGMQLKQHAKKTT